jgi:CRP/FNR family transcriptional regulator, cyclic AMP receptor protein
MWSIAQLEERLARNPLFEGAPGAALHALAKVAVIAEHAKGRTIFQRGEQSEDVYLVLQGCIRIVGYSEKGGEITLNMMNAGDIFGEVAAISRGVRTSDACVVEKSSLASITRRALLSTMEAYPPVAIRIATVLCERLRRTTEMVDSIVFHSLERRLALLLAQLLDRYGRADPEGIIIELRLGQRELDTRINPVI